MRTLLTLLVVTVSILTHAYASQDNSPIIKSPADPRQYDTFTLKNGLEVVIASDPAVVTNAVSLTVAVGSYQDPEQQQGLAHFLEHMIFMGSAQYPQPNVLKAFVEVNGGMSNAFTGAQETTYFFSIAAQQISPALDKFSAAIQAPLFAQDMLDKEINAVNAEWQSQYQTDGFVISRVNALTGNPAHPAHKLGVGNLKTLKNSKDNQLISALQKFHRDYYSADLMKLSVVGKQPLAELRALVEKYFSAIPRRKTEPYLTQKSAFTKQNLTQHIFVKSKVQGSILALQFPLLNNIDKWPVKPNTYIHSLLDSEEPHTLLASLRELALVRKMTVAIEPMSYGYDGAVFISFELTEQGERQKSLIIRHFFSYLTLIAEKGVDSRYADELRNTMALNFEEFNAPDPLSLAMHLSRSILHTSAKLALYLPNYYAEFDPQAIRDVLAQISPQNMRLWHISENESTDIQLQHAEGSYSTLAFSQDELAAWKLPVSQLLLPPLQQPLGGSPQIAKLPAVDEEQDFHFPRQVLDTQGVRAFLAHSQHFQGKEGVLSTKMLSSHNSQNVENFIYSHLLNNIFAKKNENLLQRAQRRSRITIQLGNDNFANTVINLYGRSKGQSELLKELFKQYQNLELEQQDFDQEIGPYVDSLQSVERGKLTQQLLHHAMQTTNSPPILFSDKQRLQALETVTFSGLKAFQQQVLKSSFIDLMAFGNYQPAELKALAQELRETIGVSQVTAPWYYESAYKPEAGTAVMNKQRVMQDGVGLLDSYVYPHKSEKILVQLTMLNRLFSTPFFNTMRSEKQLGYVVMSNVVDIHGYPAFNLLIESNNTGLQELKETILGFQGLFAAMLADVDDAIVTQVKDALVAEMSKKPENIYAESSPYFNDWSQNKLQFDTQAKHISLVKHTSKQDLVRLFDEIFVQGYNSNMMIQLKGKGFEQSDYFSWSKLVVNKENNVQSAGE